LLSISCDLLLSSSVLFFFFNATPTSDLYTLSLHDALPILALVLATRSLLPLGEIERHFSQGRALPDPAPGQRLVDSNSWSGTVSDRKSTRLNSSHDQISYAVFCLKKKKKKKNIITH